MSINTKDGNIRYMNVIPSFAKLLAKQSQELNSPELMVDAISLKEEAYKTALNWGAGSLFPMISESIIPKVSKYLGDGSLTDASGAKMDISDGSDVKTALIQSCTTKDSKTKKVTGNYNASSVSSMKGKIGGIRTIAINDKIPQKHEFHFLNIPKEILKMDYITNYDKSQKKHITDDFKSITQDSIEIRFDMNGIIPIESEVWSAQCTFEEYCLMEEGNFINHYETREVERKRIFTEKRDKFFSDCLAIILGQKYVSLEYATSKIDGFGSSYNSVVKNVKNPSKVTTWKKFTETQRSLLSGAIKMNAEDKKDKERDIIYLELLTKLKTSKPILQQDMVNLVKGGSVNWFVNSAESSYFFGEERTNVLLSILRNNLIDKKRAEFKAHIHLIQVNTITSIAQLEKLKIEGAYPSRFRPSYEKGNRRPAYYAEAVYNWKDTLKAAFTLNKELVKVENNQVDTTWDLEFKGA